MRDDGGTLREIWWTELLPWLGLLTTFRRAIGVSKLLTATAGLVLTTAGWWALAELFSGTADPWLQQAVAEYQVWPWDWHAESAQRGAIVSAIEFVGLGGSVDASDAAWLNHNPLVEAWWSLSRPFRQLFAAELTLKSLGFVLLCALWVLVVWVPAGGIITRIAAVEMARDERCSWPAALAHVRARWSSYFWAPLWPLLAALIVAALWYVPSLLLRSDVGILITGLVWGLFLVSGALLAVLALGLAFGWPLMWATISVEGMDAFDALSRCYAYTFQRPLHYFGYAVLLTVYGMVAWLVVALFSSGVVQLSSWTLSWGSGGQRMQQIMQEVPEQFQLVGGISVTSGPPETTGDELSRIGQRGAAVIGFWMAAVKLVAVAFMYSFFWTSATGIYYLLRRDTDATELDEVFLGDEDQPHGLPPLGEDAAGVAMVDEASEPPTIEAPGESGQVDP